MLNSNWDSLLVSYCYTKKFESSFNIEYQCGKNESSKSSDILQYIKLDLNFLA